MRTTTSFALTLCLTLALSGCSVSGLLGGGKPAAYLLTLTADQTPTANGGAPVRPDAVLAVSLPMVPQAIAVNRIPVSKGGNAIAYVKDAAWVEPPARMFQRMLAETVRSKTGRTVLDPKQLPVATGQVLSGHLLRFDIAETSPGAGRAIVTYDATIVSNAGKTIRTRRFEASEAVSTIEARAAGSALNKAANTVAADVAAWVG
jgi:cholesterol transport system auxiliary component